MNLTPAAAGIAVVGLAFALTACQPDTGVLVANNSDQTIVIQYESADGPKDQATLKPGEGFNILPSYENKETNCTVDANYRAVDEQGALVAELTEICSAGRWDITN